MIQDSQLIFSALQSIAAAAGDVVSTNYYDTGAVQDVGIGEEVYVAARIGTAVTSAGAATVQVVLQTDDNTSFISPKEFPLTGALALAALTANTFIFKGRLPIGLERYLRIVYRIGTATTTAGTADAFIVKDMDAYQFLAKNFTVS